MKNLINITIGLVVGIVISFSVSTFANNQITAQYANFNFEVDGIKKSISTQPIVVEGKSYLPVKDVGDLVGFNVGYDSSTRTIKLSSGDTSDQTKGSASSDPAKHRDNYDFKKLPITQEKDGVKVTVHSITQNDRSTDVEVSVTNSSEVPIKMNFLHTMRINHEVEGKEAIVTGGSHDFRDFDKRIEVGESVTGVVKLKKFDDGADNLIFNTSVNGNRVDFHILLE